LIFGLVWSLDFGIWNLAIRLPCLARNGIGERAQNGKRCVESRLLPNLTLVLLINSLCYNKSAPVTAGTLEGLNNLPAEASVNPVFAGTGIFITDLLYDDRRELKRRRIC
jgi:hypothetical protein